VSDARRVLGTVVGVAAVLAPAFHSATDFAEWYQQGFSPTQLWVNYLAFLPMGWLLLGLSALHRPGPGIVMVLGAVLYGAAFTYFSHTTLYALAEGLPDYAALWNRLGVTYTVHGALMVGGGLLFTAAALRAAWLPRFPLLLFGSGLLLNLVLALLPVPELAQTLGSVVRNAGLIGLGLGVLSRRGGELR